METINQCNDREQVKVVKGGSRYGSDRSNVIDVDEVQEVIVEIKLSVLNMIGYQSLSGMMSIPGIKFHHINLDEDQPYMGAGVKRQMRQAKLNSKRKKSSQLMMNLKKN